MTDEAPPGSPGTLERTLLLAMSMALSALGIDPMLPAFGQIRAGFGMAPDSPEVTGLVTAYLVGLALGQIAYGPLADRYGRRSTLYVSYGIYAVGALAAALSPTFPLLLASRFVWGLGAGGPRVITVAMIRDTFEGEKMARAMSFIMAAFIVVPVLSPMLGAAMVSVTSWRWVFGACLIAALIMAVWALRLPETLRAEHRTELRLGRVLRVARSVLGNRQTAGYTLAMTLLYGVFASYLGSCEAIFGMVFDRASMFPIFFGGLAAFMGGAIFINGRVVVRIGTRRLVRRALLVYLGISAGLLVACAVSDGRPPLGLFLVAMAGLLSAHGMLLPNLNTLAMAPMAQSAGTASSIMGAIQIAVGAVLGSLLDRTFDGTVQPLAFGFLGAGALAFALFHRAEATSAHMVG